MIQPSELRIGNLVSISDTPCAVRAIYEDGQVQLEYKYNSSGEVKTSLVIARTFEGIPITMEWLTRLGFTVEHTIGGWLRWQKGDFKLLDRKLPHTVMEPVLFVHQLQNLYHSITGNELEVKP